MQGVAPPRTSSAPIWFRDSCSTPGPPATGRTRNQLVRVEPRTRSVEQEMNRKKRATGLPCLLHPGHPLDDRDFSRRVPEPVGSTTIGKGSEVGVAGEFDGSAGRHPRFGNTKTKGFFTALCRPKNAEGYPYKPRDKADWRQRDRSLYEDAVRREEEAGWKKDVRVLLQDWEDTVLADVWKTKFPGFGGVHPAFAQPPLASKVAATAAPGGKAATFLPAAKGAKR